jgi:uncharacterized protein YqeY
MKARDRVAVAALRATLGAIENAEAVGGAAEAADGTEAAVDGTAAAGTGGLAGRSLAGRSLAIEQSPVGVGAAEVPRRALTEAQVEQIVRAEVAEREAAARDYERAGRAERAERLRHEIGVLSAHLG